ncbi:hypothetical protein KOI35_15030 [Actinoplanes bogorensis]|uniref:Uncharacterized protein n=1 Tax=Paractinoplanes bogorensis TaxID=1610840 RepID=A0ABS5YMW7_9ACTN|nr:hypothetical protein [Actinoplanes bogorensis]MBU2664814.1 hypothetical protein [Actinoplanes bogorensis]
MGAPSVRTAYCVRVGSDDFLEMARALGHAHSSLQGLPPKSTLAKTAACSHNTIRKWLAGESRPDDVDKFILVVRAIRDEALRQGPLTKHRAIVRRTDEEWRSAYREAAGRRSGDTSAAMNQSYGRRALETSRAGRPVRQCDPLAHGVRGPLDPETPSTERLIPFVPRSHDHDVAQRVAAGGVVSLVGHSSTGKSRSAWEAVRVLDDDWYLWQPVTWVEADRVGPRTVVWLNDANDHLSEENAEMLLRILADPGRAPVTVLCTLWSDEWRTLTAKASPGEIHPHHRARTLLLAGSVIEVPRIFIPQDPADLRNAVATDSRWRRAAGEAEGQVIQYFAGVPALNDTYRFGPVMVHALIAAAMDARRLGWTQSLSAEFLTEAATGYPTDAEWDAVDDDWPAPALAEASLSVRGLPGALHSLKSRLRRPAESKRYTLAPYLEELGRTERATEVPPESFWVAARRRLDPTAWAMLARQADGYGLFRIAASMRKVAIEAGVSADPEELLHRIEGHEVTRWVAEKAPCTKPHEVFPLINELVIRNAQDSLLVLYRRAAREADLDAWGVDRLLEQLHTLDDPEATAAFLQRDPARWLPLEADLLVPLAKLDRPTAARFAQRLVDDPTLFAPEIVSALSRAGFRDEVGPFVSGHTLTSATAFFLLLEALHEYGFDVQVRHLISSDHPAPTDPRDVQRLLHVLIDSGLDDKVTAVIELIDNQEPPWTEQMRTDLPPFVRDRLRPPPEQPAGPVISLRKPSVFDRVKDLRGLSPDAASKAVEETDRTDPHAVMSLLRALRLDEQNDLRDVLVRRLDPLDLTGLDYHLTLLASELGPGPQARSIMTRVVADCGPWNSRLVRHDIVPTLRGLGMDDLVVRLAERIRDAGNFAKYADLAPAEAAKFLTYGREPNRSPSDPWGWADLA